MTMTKDQAAEIIMLLTTAVVFLAALFTVVLAHVRRHWDD
jgi:hypothetical protein